jgi:hypothetical protein
MKTCYTLLLLGLLSSCVASQKEATSGNINADAPYYWSVNAFPRTLLVSEDFDDDEYDSIVSMGEAWEDAVENEVDFFDHGDGTDRANEVSSTTLKLNSLGKDAVNGIYRITNWPSELHGSALAVTQIFGRRHNLGDPDEFVKIEHADILINEHLYNFRTSHAFVSGTFDFRTVILHEMGHFLGLPHRDGNSVMVDSIGNGTVLDLPTSGDQMDLATLYHLNTSFSGFGIAASRPRYAPRPGDKGVEVQILLELRADGECVHRENGVVVKRHRSLEMVP